MEEGECHTAHADLTIHVQRSLAKSHTNVKADWLANCKTTVGMLAPFTFCYFNHNSHVFITCHKQQILSEVPQCQCECNRENDLREDLVEERQPSLLAPELSGMIRWESGL